MSRVKILNPAHGGDFTSLGSAQRYVDQGRARWERPRRSNPHGVKPELAIRFLDSPLDAKVRATQPAPGWDGTDRRFIPATLEEQEAIPLIPTAPPVHQRPLFGREGHRYR